VKHSALSYKPRANSAVTASSDIIFVAQFMPPAVHVYGWNVDQNKSIKVDHQKLAVRESEWINSIYWMEGNILLIAIGNKQHVTMLKAYQVGP
jgi:hypothetical protein